MGVEGGCGLREDGVEGGWEVPMRDKDDGR